MSRSQVTVFAVLLATLIPLSQFACSQEPAGSRVVPSVPIPPVLMPYCCAYAYKCAGGTWKTLKGTSAVSHEVACGNAVAEINLRCPNGAEMYPIPLLPFMCMLISNDEISNAESAMMAAVHEPSMDSNKWQVVGTLCYCDGTEGIEARVAGATRCQAICNARAILCEIKKLTHPCKRAYIKFRVVQSPCACAPVMHGR